jgi:DNA-binding NarL/FixJ family response regulator
LGETLDVILTGVAEKDAARRLRVTRNTVHGYIKQLYDHFGVCSRAELMSIFMNHD